MKKFFAPEFRNRLDGIITFSKLGKEVMMKIVGKFLVELKAQVKDKKVDITISDEALDYLVEKGFNKKGYDLANIKENIYSFIIRYKYLNEI